MFKSFEIASHTYTRPALRLPGQYWQLDTSSYCFDELLFEMYEPIDRLRTGVLLLLNLPTGSAYPNQDVPWSDPLPRLCKKYTSLMPAVDGVEIRRT